MKNKIILKFFVSIIFILAISIISFSITLADTGPKPTSYIEITGIDEDYYFDLLIEYDYEVPILSSLEIQEQLSWEYYSDIYPTVLNGYQDDDGFASYTLYTSMPHTISQLDNPDEYLIGYFSAPSVFKIVIVTESNEIYISDIINKTYFSASFVFDISLNSISEEEHTSYVYDGDNYFDVYYNVGDVNQGYPIIQMIIFAIVGLIVTLIFEIGILYLFKYRNHRTFKIVFYTNIATQLFLNLFIIFSYYIWYIIIDSFGLLIIGEFLVFMIEIVIYSYFIKENHKVNMSLYAIIANAASFVLGYLFVVLMIN